METQTKKATMAVNVIPLKPITRMQEMPNTFGEYTSNAHRKLRTDPDYPQPFEINDTGGLALLTHELVDYYSKKPRINCYQGK